MLQAGLMDSSLPKESMSKQEYTERKRNNQTKLTEAEALTAAFVPPYKSSRNPATITDWDRHHVHVGQGVAAVFEFTDDGVGDTNDEEKEEEGEKEEEDDDGEEKETLGKRSRKDIRMKIYNETYQGKVIGYAPSTAEALGMGVSDELYEIEWEDGEIQYYSIVEYVAAAELYQHLYGDGG